MKRLLAALALVVAVGSATACDDPHKGERCVNMGTRLVAHHMTVNKKMTTYWVTEAHCKKWEKIPEPTPR